MRCDANETCWGNTVLCISRCALWNRNRLFTFRFLLFLFSWIYFFLFLSEFHFCPDLGKIKKEREQASHAFIIIIPEGGETGRSGATCALFLVIWEYRGIFSLVSRFPLSQPWLLVFTPTIPNPCFFLASGPPPTRSQGPGYPLTPFIPPCQTRSPDTPGRRERKGWYFHPSGSGTAGVTGEGGVSK